MNPLTMKATFAFIFLYLYVFSATASQNIQVFPDKNYISAPSADQYEWYFNGSKINNETQQILKIQATGLYTLVYKKNGNIGVQSIYLIKAKNSLITVYLIGDSTVTDYSVLPNYTTEYYPMAGWGEKLQTFLRRDSLNKVPFLNADSVDVENYAVAGQSSKNFWKDWRWKYILSVLKPSDFVFIQFGHNDELDCSVFPERCVPLDSFKTYLRWYIDSIQKRNAIPVLITPMVRNLWKNGAVYSDHGNYPDAMKQIGAEKNVRVIDLTQRSIELFNRRGQNYVTNNYFMIFNAGTYPNFKVTQQYPNGSPSSDSTHFRTEGAIEMARLIYNELKSFSSSIVDTPQATAQIYPNPAKDYIVVKRPSPSKENIYISDTKGSIVMAYILNNTEHRINISTFSRGLYIIRIGNFKFKLIKL